MKTLIVCYSYDGNTALAADVIKQKLCDSSNARSEEEADVFRIEIEHEKRFKGFFKYLWGVKQILSKKAPVLKPYAIDFDRYDLLIFGSPVWASSPAPAITAFLKQLPVVGKKTAIFCCCAGNKGRTLDSMKSRLSKNTVVGEIVFINPLRQDKKEFADAVGAWVEQLILPGAVCCGAVCR
ncbi:MAG: flavodoxin [Treponema sp.]|jgi:flavodoxin|nr:flavodoxin [Treponema sp.]